MYASKTTLFFIFFIFVIGCSDNHESDLTAPTGILWVKPLEPSITAPLDMAHQVRIHAHDGIRGPLHDASSDFLKCAGLPPGTAVPHINIVIQKLSRLPNESNTELINIHLFKDTNGCYGAYITYNFEDSTLNVPKNSLKSGYCIKSNWCWPPDRIFAYALGDWASKTLDAYKEFNSAYPEAPPDAQIIDKFTYENRDGILAVGSTLVAVLILFLTKASFAQSIESFDPAVFLNLNTWAGGGIQDEWQVYEQRVNVLSSANLFDEAMNELNRLEATLTPVVLPPQLPRPTFCAKWNSTSLINGVWNVYGSEAAFIAFDCDFSDVTLWISRIYPDDPWRIDGEWYIPGSYRIFNTAGSIYIYATKTGYLRSDILELCIVLEEPPSSPTPPKVATPYITPLSGTSLNYPVTINISCDTSGATIMYTLDGTIPSLSNGIQHNGLASTIYWSGSWGVKAKAFKSGYVDSDLAERGYQVNPPSPAPTVKWNAPVISPGPTSTFTTSALVLIAPPSSEVTLKYTTDGTTPSRTHGYESHLYPYTSFTVYNTTTIKAMVYGGSVDDSDVATSILTKIGGKVATPTFSPNGGTFTSSQTWYVNCSTSGVAIKVTCDGSTPSRTNGIVYTGGMQSFGTTTAKAMAYKDGMTDSDVKTVTFTKVSQPSSQVADPVIFPGGGTFSTSIIWSVSTTTSGATIMVTCDGSTPSRTNGWLYTGPLQSYGTTTAKAMAYKDGMTDSNVVTVTFTKQ